MKATERMKTVRDKDRSSPAAKTVSIHTKPNVGEVMINGLVVTSDCADLGADRNALPSHLLVKLQELGSNSDVIDLDDPVHVEVAGGMTVVCIQDVTVDIQLQIAAGVVKINRVTCFVMQANEQDFSLVINTLVSLGIDVKRQPELLAGCSHATIVYHKRS